MSSNAKKYFLNRTCQISPSKWELLMPYMAVFPHVLGYDGVELIFLTVATMGPCFGFVLKTQVLIIQGWFGVFFTAGQVLHSIKAFSALCSTPAAQRLGMHRQLDKDTASTASTSDHRDSPSHTLSHSAYRVGGRRRQWGPRQGQDIWRDGICPLQ